MINGNDSSRKKACTEKESEGNIWNSAIKQFATEKDGGKAIKSILASESMISILFNF